MPQNKLPEAEKLKLALASKALELGFGVMRITTPDAIPDAPGQLAAWLARGHQGEMSWMNERTGQRADPAQLWGDTRSIIMLGMSYAPDVDPLAALEHKSQAAISVYASRRDYHDVIKGRLKTLAGLLAARSGAEVKVFVDTAPVMETPLAAAAGLGWQGKHTVLVSRTHGSWLFLGAIFTTAVLPTDEAETDHCGTCRRCLDICPTNAVPAPYQLDARRCIAYLTIEHQGVIDREFRPGIGNRVFGCDDCLAVCPWNKFASAAQDMKLALRNDLAKLPLETLSRLDDAGFRQLFAATPVKRTGRDRFMRNVLIAMGNSKDVSLVPAVVARLDDTSPLVRGMAVWALSQLDKAQLARLAQPAMAAEIDAEVRAEWRHALACGAEDRGI